MEVEVEQEHSKIRLESAETMLQWSDVLVVAEQVQVRFQPIRLILQGVDPPQMGMSRSVMSTSPAKLN